MLLGAFYHTILAVLFAFFAVLLMAVVLLQRGRGVGLAGAFGGAGGHTAFGAKTGDFLTWATIFAAAGLLLFAIILNFVFRPAENPLGGPAPAPITQPLASETIPATTEQPAETPAATPMTPPPAAETPTESAAPDGAGSDSGPDTPEPAP